MSIYTDYGVSSTAKDRANQLQAEITRAQYDDYQTRFQPYLNTLTAEVSDSQIAADKAQWNNTFMSQAQNNGLVAQGMTSRNLSRFGATNDSRSNQAGMRSAGINASGNAVSNMNNMSQSVDDRVMSLLSGQTLTGA